MLRRQQRHPMKFTKVTLKYAINSFEVSLFSCRVFWQILKLKGERKSLSNKRELMKIKIIKKSGWISPQRTVINIKIFFL